MHEGMIITIYMDDLFIFAQDVKIFHWLINLLCNKFSMINLKEMEFILRLQVTRDRSQRKFMLAQSSYDVGLLTIFEMNVCKPIATPLVANVKLSRSQGLSLAKEEAKMVNIAYKRVEGNLMYGWLEKDWI
jgi:hypothetical protein